METNAAPGPLLLATVVPAAAIGALAWALGWLVERSARASQAVLRATPLVVLLAVGSGLATFRLPWLQPVAWWSGPWGWAALPSIAAAGEVGMSSRAGTGAWPIAAGLLTLSTLAAVGVAVRTAGTIPAEELSRRAAPGSRVRNALFLLDFRAAAQVRREAGRRITTLRRTRIPRPRSPALAVVWRDLLSLLRTPTRALAALAGPPLVAAVAAGALLPAALTRPAIAVLGVAVALGYLASAALIDPVRTEMAYPFGERHLPWAPQRLVLLHLTVPIAVLWLLGGGSALVTAVLLSMSSAGVVATVAGVLLTAPVLICCAALAAVRPQPSAELLAMGDAGVGMFTARLLVGPQLAALLAYLPAFLAWTALQGGVGLSRVLLGSAGWATAAVALLLPRLQRHVAP